MHAGRGSRPKQRRKGTAMLTPPPPILPKRKPPRQAGGNAASEPGAVPGISASEGLHIGIDEAGRGCLAGPVVAAAVLFPAGFAFADQLPGLNDSKKLSEKQRTALAGQITRSTLYYGTGLSWQDEIDSVNILHATLRAMARAVLALAARQQDAERIHRRKAPQPLPCLVIDGNQTIPAAHWHSCAAGVSAAALSWEQYLPLPLTMLPTYIPALPVQFAVVDGDALIPSVSAASILAKTVRDGIMSRLDSFYPGYGLAKHKGYGTKEHLARLAEKGPCRLHRRTFRRVLPENKQLTLF